MVATNMEASYSELSASLWLTFRLQVKLSLWLALHLDKHRKHFEKEVGYHMEMISVKHVECIPSDSPNVFPASFIRHYWFADDGRIYCELYKHHGSYRSHTPRVSYCCSNCWFGKHTNFPQMVGFLRFQNAFLPSILPKRKKSRKVSGGYASGGMYRAPKNQRYEDCWIWVGLVCCPGWSRLVILNTHHWTAEWFDDLFCWDWERDGFCGACPAGTHSNCDITSKAVQIGTMYNLSA